jgi:hypothetical protein
MFFWLALRRVDSVRKCSPIVRLLGADCQGKPEMPDHPKSNDFNTTRLDVWTWQI